MSKKYPSLVVMNLTTDCNLRCKYCYASAGIKKEYMAITCARKIIDEMFSVNDEISVLFHGGEPLMNYEVIKEVIDYVKNKYNDKKINYFIQTNCILIDKEKSSFLKKNNIKICISIDGNTEESNGCRINEKGKNSLSHIKKAINILKSDNNEITALAVLNKKNYMFVDEIIDFFVSNDINNFSFNHFIKSGRGNENSFLAITPKELYETTKKIINKVEEYQKNGKLINERITYHLIKSVAFSKKEFMCMNSPCGAGNHLIGITPNGDVFPCDDLSGIANFKLGNIMNSSLTEILNNNIMIKYFNHCSFSNILECNTCNFRTKCGAGCASRKFFENGTIYSVDPICEFYKLIIPYIENEIASGRINTEYYK